jgi:hypothetical protein
MRITAVPGDGVKDRGIHGTSTSSSSRQSVSGGVAV